MNQVKTVDSILSQVLSKLIKKFLGIPDDGVNAQTLDPTRQFNFEYRSTCLSPNFSGERVHSPIQESQVDRVVKVSDVPNDHLVHHLLHAHHNHNQNAKLTSICFGSWWCGAGKASGTSRTNPRTGVEPTMRKGSYVMKLRSSWRGSICQPPFQQYQDDFRWPSCPRRGGQSLPRDAQFQVILSTFTCDQQIVVLSKSPPVNDQLWAHMNTITP